MSASDIDKVMRRSRTGCVADMCSVFERFEELQSRSQSQRFQVYQLLNELMINHRAGAFLPSILPSVLICGN